MKMHNTYSYGQLFCFSGLDGETSRTNDFVAMFLDEPITLRFHFETTITLQILMFLPKLLPFPMLH